MSNSSPEPGDGNDEHERLCPDCHGSGYDSAGAPCLLCCGEGTLTYPGVGNLLSRIRH